VNGERSTDVDVEIFASRGDRHLGVVRYTIRPQFDGEVQFSCPIRSIFKLKAASLPGDKDKSGIWMYTQTSPPGRAPLAAA
ncbi:MAG: hypothetical protein QF662_02200, partial [Phycisphaerae bacterium]|nr:hypothetical protein [Phycisphaerae bacterium]